tara:strand:- start:1006 stop:2820 length:1815 start_codon:yes stop_codon:yes gene_type:complete
MYLNDLNSSRHNVEKLNRILADTFKHDVDLSEMTTDSLNRMLNTTNAKMTAIKESDLKYWENPQYNKLGLIQHQLKTYITEIAPTRGDSKRVKAKESTIMEADLDQAEVLLAAQELVDEMQKMVENVAEMQVQKLMPIVDAMKEQVGFDVAEQYNAAADGALGALLDQMKTAKEAVENATLAARGEPVNTPAATDMGMDDADMDPEAPMDDMGADEFGGDDAAAGEENPVGRELKGESALANMERGALAEKKFLESKDKLFKMVESGQMSQTDFINVINELDEGWAEFARDAKAVGKVAGGGLAKGLGYMLKRDGDKDRSAQDGGFSDRLGRGLTNIGNDAYDSGIDTLKKSFAPAVKYFKGVKEAPEDKQSGVQKLPGKMTPELKKYLSQFGLDRGDVIDMMTDPSASPRQFQPLLGKLKGDERVGVNVGEPVPNQGGVAPKLQNKRGFDPMGDQVPPASLQNKRGFTPGKQVPPASLQNKRGFTPGVQTPPTGGAKPAPIDGGIAPGTTKGGPSKLRQRQMNKQRQKQANDAFLKKRLDQRYGQGEFAPKPKPRVPDAIGPGSTFTVNPILPNPKPPAPLDGGIKPGTTAGGKSKLRQRLGK